MSLQTSYDAISAFIERDYPEAMNVLTEAGLSHRAAVGFIANCREIGKDPRRMAHRFVWAARMEGDA